MTAPDLQTLTDICTPWCIRVAVTLRIPQLLADGVGDVNRLAVRADCDPHALHRLLGQLTQAGVCVETAPRTFALTELGRGLLDDPFLDLTGVGGRMAHAWATMLTYVRTGRPGYHEIFGMSFWEDLAAHPDVGASFDDLMGVVGHGVPDPRLPLTGGWSSVRTVVDVGGGTGAMLTEILRAQPHVHGTLLDLPGTVGRASFPEEIQDRVTTVGQSFFEPLPAGADVYLLLGVLNDWPDEETVTILTRCAAAMGRSGRLLIHGGVIPDGTAPVMTPDAVLLGGREDTVTEFRERAAAAGLTVEAAGQDQAGFVECSPA